MNFFFGQALIPVELDTFLGLDVGATKEIVEQAMAGHAIAQAELIGCYERIQG